MTSFLKELANEMSVTAVAEVPGAAPAPAKMAVEHLNLFYGDFQGLRDVNLTFPENQVTALIGPSGCGKSTLSRTVMLLQKPTEGRIFLEGEELTALSASEVRKRRPDFQMVFQDPYASLNPRFTVYATLKEALQSRRKRTFAQTRDDVAELMEKVGLSPSLMRKYPHEFSGGMRQRVVIAIAVACRPQILICDEPTTALDVVVQKGILKMLMRLQKQLKNTMVIVSHDMGVHYQITDRMAIMYSGSIIELGPTDAIFNDPIHPYTKMLVDSLPRVGDKSQKVGIPGRPPALKNPPPGCRFAARCPHATDRCRQEIPEFIEVKPGRFAACHLLKKEGEKNG